MSWTNVLVGVVFAALGAYATLSLIDSAMCKARGGVVVSVPLWHVCISKEALK